MRKSRNQGTFRIDFTITQTITQNYHTNCVIVAFNRKLTITLTRLIAMKYFYRLTALVYIFQSSRTGLNSQGFTKVT